MTDSTLKEFEAIIDRIKRDAYQKGWQDAVNHIVATATDAVKAAPPPAGSTLVLELEPKSDDRQIVPRATRGSVPRILRIVLDQAGQNGVTANEAYEQARAMEHNVASSSIRATLRRLVEQGVAQKTGQRWFLTPHPPDVEVTKKETAGFDSHPPAAPSTPNQGEPDGPTLA